MIVVSLQWHSSNASNACVLKTLGHNLADVDQFTFKNQHRSWQHNVFQHVDLCAKAQLNASVCVFSDIIKPSASAYSLGTFPRKKRVAGLVLNFIYFEMSKKRLYYGGIRCPTIANLRSAAYGVSLVFL